MIYQVRAELYVQNHHDLDDVLDKIEDLKDKLLVVNPGQENEECSIIETIENRHDENPNGACEIRFHWDNATGG